MEVGGWREIAADQNLRMAALMLEQQGQINDLQAEVKRLKDVLAATADRAMAQGYELVGAQQELASTKHALDKAQREIKALYALFVDGVYEVDPDCACEGRCKYCAAMGCEACCEGYAADHGVLTEDEKASRQAIWCARCQMLVAGANLADHNASAAHIARDPQPLTGFVRDAVVEEARASVALDGETVVVGAERWVDPERPFPFLRSSPAAEAGPETDEPVRHWCSFPCEKWVEPGEALAHFGHVITRGDA